MLHLSLNAEKYDSREGLVDILERQLRQWEELYRTGGEGITHSGRFMTVIRRACEQTGRRVVVLIDEYDKPLLRSFDNPELQHDFRETLTAFYTVLKDADPWLQFVFITGVTKFAQMGIFSNLNQLNDISFDLDYNTLCGMTRAEIEATFSPELEALAVKSNATCRQVMDRLTRQYDGYRFTKDEEFTSMYNPFSVLSALQKRSYGNYWFATARSDYQTVFYLVFQLMGQFTETEVRSARGRADAVVKTPDYIYVFEFKLNDSAEAALRQIDEKGYLLPYQADGRKVVKVGVAFEKEERNIGEWVIGG